MSRTVKPSELRGLDNLPRIDANPDLVARAPSRALQDSVFGLWGVAVAAGPAAERVFPSASIHLVVNGSGEYESRNPATGETFRVGAVFCSGLQTGVLLNRNPDAIRNVGARIRIDAARSLGLDPTALAARVLAVDDPDLIALARELRDGLRLAEAVDGLERWLEAQRETGPAPDPHVRRFLTAVEGRPGMRVAEAARHAGVGRTALTTAARRATGVSPKTAADAIRFDRFLDAVTVRGDRGWGDLAAEAGFFDQSHLIRVFRAATGLTPERYAHLVRNGGPATARFLPEPAA